MEDLVPVQPEPLAASAKAPYPLPPSPPAQSPQDVLVDLFASLDDQPVSPPADSARAAESSVSSSEHEALKQEHEALRREHEALQREHAALLQSREQHDASEAQLSLARSLLEPLLALEKLASFEEVRCAESPVLPALVKTAARFHRALGEHAIEGVTPVPGEAYDAAVHELARVRASAAATSSVAASSSSSSSAAAAAGAESGAGLAVVECHLPGLRHTPTGTVLRRAIVVAKPSEDHRPRSGKATATAAATAPSPGAPAATPPQQADGGSSSGQPAVHVLQPNDTIQGVALKYGVSPAALIRLNKLPGGDKTALHLRTSVAIPPPPPPSNSTTAAAAAAAARRAARRAALERRGQYEEDEVEVDAYDDEDEDDDDDEDDGEAAARRGEGSLLLESAPLRASTRRRGVRGGSSRSSRAAGRTPGGSAAAAAVGGGTGRTRSAQWLASLSHSRWYSTPS